MTRRVVVAGVLAVCLTALIVGVVAYVLVAVDARNDEDRVLKTLVAHAKQTLGPRTTYSQLAQLTNSSGMVVRETDALMALGQFQDLKRGFATVTLGPKHLRVLTKPVGARLLGRKHSTRGDLLSVAVSDEPALTSLRDLRRGVLIAMAAGALLASLLLVWITRRALAPVRDTAAVADRIVSTGELTARVPAPPGRDEIAQLTESINRMLDHLESSDAALRRMVADASHELRSPVTTLRGNLELLQGGVLSVGDQTEALADTVAEAERLGHLVEELLTLARADTVTESVELCVFDVAAEALAGTRARLLHPSPEFAAATVMGDPVGLRAMLRNLAENADRYAGGSEVSVDGDPHWVDVHVADHGPGIEPAERAAIFGRFSRGEAGAGLPGSGLGLAIVAATARTHGGSVSVDDTPGGGATFRVRLPRSVPQRD